MNTRIIMTTCALVLGITGIFLTFIPDEIVSYLNLETSKILAFLLQILGALYFAFGILNWMNKTAIIGGIYNRPITIANFSHFMIAGLALAKGLISDNHSSYIIWITAIIYLVFAVSFGIILFQHPVSKTSTK